MTEVRRMAPWLEEEGEKGRGKGGPPVAEHDGDRVEHWKDTRPRYSAIPGGG